MVNLILRWLCWFDLISNVAEKIREFLIRTPGYRNCRTMPEMVSGRFELKWRSRFVLEIHQSLCLCMLIRWREWKRLYQFVDLFDPGPSNHDSTQWMSPDWRLPNCVLSWQTCQGQCKVCKHTNTENIPLLVDQFTIDVVEELMNRWDRYSFNVPHVCHSMISKLEVSCKCHQGLSMIQTRAKCLSATMNTCISA